MKKRATNLSENQISKVIRLFTTAENNSTQDIVWETGFTVYQVDKTINAYLEDRRRMTVCKGIDVVYEEVSASDPKKE